jgi:hypothetical protein
MNMRPLKNIHRVNESRTAGETQVRFSPINMALFAVTFEVVTTQDGYLIAAQ